MDKKKVLTVVIVIAAICVLISGGILVKGIMDEKEQEKQLEVAVSQTDGVESTLDMAESIETTSEEEAIEEGTVEEVVLVDNPYESYFEQNSDMAAWLLIPETKIDYPVMQTMEDENYYLRRSFEGKSDNNGCLILDTDSTLEPNGTNLIIHGHNMKSGAMFGTLQKYKEEDFYREHKTMKLYTKEMEHNYEVIAVFYSQVYKKSDEVFKFYKFFQADTEAEFHNFYDNIKELSIYDTGVRASFGDKFLTLSTCAYHVENGRFVVVAKEVEQGDSYK